MFGKGSKDKKDEEAKSPIDALLNTFTTHTERMHALAGFPGVLLILGVFLVLLDVIPGYDAKPEIIYLAIASIIGSVVTYLAEWFYNLRMSQARSELIRSYLSLLIERFLPQEAQLQDIQATINSIINPMLGMESQKDK